MRWPCARKVSSVCSSPAPASFAHGRPRSPLYKLWLLAAEEQLPRIAVVTVPAGMILVALASGQGSRPYLARSEAGHRRVTKCPPEMFDFYGHEFWRFVYVQHEVAALGETFVQFRPMQAPASFNPQTPETRSLEAIKAAHGGNPLRRQLGTRADQMAPQ